jgi:hypothetical protein
MATVKSLRKALLVSMPKRLEPKIMCPVEEMGKNSVIPSIMANTMASKIVMLSF